MFDSALILGQGPVPSIDNGFRASRHVESLEEVKSTEVPINDLTALCCIISSLDFSPFHMSPPSIVRRPDCQGQPDGLLPARTARPTGALAPALSRTGESRKFVTVFLCKFCRAVHFRANQAQVVDQEMHSFTQVQALSSGTKL